MARDEKGRWLPGTSGNPKGRTPGTVYVKEALSSLLTCTEEELEEIYNDKDQPIVYRIASGRLILAQNWQDKRSDQAFDQVADRTEGKPHASASLQVHQLDDPEELMAQIEEEMRKVEGSQHQESLPSAEESVSGPDQEQADLEALPPSAED